MIFKLEFYYINTDNDRISFNFKFDNEGYKYIKESLKKEKFQKLLYIIKDKVIIGVNDSFHLGKLKYLDLDFLACISKKNRINYL
jgi:hypothetical protein